MNFLLSSATVDDLSVAIVVIIFSAIFMAAFLSAMLIPAAFPASPWFCMDTDIYSSWAMRLGVSSMATLPGRWRACAARWR
jgi:hypothetical protein